MHTPRRASSDLKQRLVCDAAPLWAPSAPGGRQFEHQIFFATWVHQISTALQLGNASMIHNIPLGNRCKSRLQGDLQVDSTQQEVEKYLLRACQPQPGASSDPGSDSDARTAAAPDSPDPDAGETATEPEDGIATESDEETATGNRNINRNRNSNSSAAKRKACADRL